MFAPLRFVVRASFRRAGRFAACSAVAAACLAAPLSAAESVERVELPGFRPDEVGAAVVVAKFTTSQGPAGLSLVNPPAAAKSTHDRFDVVSESAGAWRIEAVDKTDKRKPVARLTFANGELTFRWESGITRADGGLLRNGGLRIDDGSAKRVVLLRKPTVAPAWPVDLKKDLTRFVVGDDLPEDSQLTLTVAGVGGVAEAATPSPAAGGLKESCFVVLKQPTAELPGARLRVILWKSGTKPEVLVRPELTPMLGGPAKAPAARTSTAGSSSTARSTSRPASGVDAFNPNQLQTMSFTSRGLANIKTQLQRDLQQTEGVLQRNNLTLAAGQRELDKWADGIIGTAEEIEAILARINRVKAQMNALNAQNRDLEGETLPNLKKQLWACPELDKLVAQWHQSATLRFRVGYELDGRTVDLLIVGDEPPAAASAGR